MFNFKNLILVLIFASPFAFGGVHNTALVLLCSSALLASAIYLASGHRVKLPLKTIVLCATGLVVLQFTPLPLPILKLLSPLAFHIKVKLPTEVGAEAGYFYALHMNIAGAWRTVLSMGSYVLLFWALTHALKSKKTSKTAENLMLISALLVSLLAISQKISGTHAVYWHIPRRFPFYGPFLNPNHGAAWIGACVPFLFFCSMKKGGRARSILFASAAAFSAAALIYSLSRGAMLALLITSAAAFVHIFKKTGSKRHYIATIAFSVVILAVLVTLGLRGAASEMATLAVPPNFRPKLWIEAVLGMLRNFPIAGAGLGAFETAFRQISSIPTPRRIEFAESDYIQILFETGIIGAILGAWALFELWQRIKKASENINKDPKACGAAFSLIFLLIHSSVNFNLAVPAIGFLTSLMAAYVFRGLTENSDTALKTKPAVYTVSGIVLVLAATSMVYGSFVSSRVNNLLSRATELRRLAVRDTALRTYLAEAAAINAQKATAIIPTAPDAYLELYSDLRTAGRYKEAAKALLCAVKTDHFNPKTAVITLHEALRTKDLKLASAAAEKIKLSGAIIGKRKAGSELSIYARMLLEAGKIDKAKEEALKIITTYPNCWRALMVKASCNALEGRWKKAEENIKSAAERAIALKEKQAFIETTVKFTKDHLNIKTMRQISHIHATLINDRRIGLDILKALSRLISNWPDKKLKTTYYIPITHTEEGPPLLKRFFTYSKNSFSLKRFGWGENAVETLKVSYSDLTAFRDIWGFEIPNPDILYADIWFRWEIYAPDIRAGQILVIADGIPYNIDSKKDGLDFTAIKNKNKTIFFIHGMYNLTSHGEMLSTLRKRFKRSAAIAFNTAGNAGTYKFGPLKIAFYVNK